MENFIVSARKYRPQNFNMVVGQKHITTTLKNAIKNNQIAHAFLFCGPRGVGKTTCARIMAKTINCTNPTPEGEACNTCGSCVSFDAGNSMNIHELDAASNNSVEDIRNLVEQVRFAPQAGKYKVYIVDEVHMLSSSAFNAFLKTLEEPPSYAIFILATTEKHKILPTILSRCQIFDFKRITLQDTVEHLEEIIEKENISAEKTALQLIAQKSEGCMRDALSILDKIVSFTNGILTYQNTVEHLNILDDDYYFKLLDALYKQDMAGAMLLYEEINQKGFEGDLVLNGFATFIRNLLVCKDARAAVLLDVLEGKQEIYAVTAQAINASYLISALNILNEAEIQFKMARNKRLHVELCLIKLSFLQQALQLSSEQGTVVKKKLTDRPIAIQQKNIPQYTVPKLASPAAQLVIRSEQPAKTIAAPLPKVMVEEPKTPATRKIIKETSSNDSKKNLLDILRAKVKEDVNVLEVQEAEDLNLEKLKNCWNDYCEKLQQDGGKPATVGTLKMAQLALTDELSFSVTVQALTQQKFIEQEKMQLTDFIQQAFNNRGIRFTILVEHTIPDAIPDQLSLNSNQRFEKLAEKYPLLKDLKERLRLDLDL
ncbi:DNA polymerase III subunit gamma/tau [Hydrotalea sp.]|uniref:DNA polymerase III subunit gamma/tau n=1 Tax=Hydrotalea sp. TaxID=2881279 RepID=UPI0026182BD1|nr:DNA polymerase III subunit gamma/tau [Hydrotalea sp.]